MPQSSLTQTLLSSDVAGFQRATQSPFLQRAAEGAVSKVTLGKWLANDRLYILGYIRGIGRLLSFLSLPETVPAPPTPQDTVTTRLLDWLIEAMVNIRREERFFVGTAHRFGIEVNLPIEDGSVPDLAKLPGLRKFEALFAGLGPGNGDLPWLESAVVFYGTEKTYLEAWSWARSQLSDTDGSDADGGALRNEFIPNWTGPEFVQFVNTLGQIIDDGVEEYLQKKGDGAKTEIVNRSLVKWRELLAAEQEFWPAMG